ncbi:unnamed protein product [Larinioides sclopetarius]|uniref:Uncharacterized protein n=1 Tax=Larinioides sclopetarius TaxID=280406 RepID=A0AAV1ZY04_9ARAC
MLELYTKISYACYGARSSYWIAPLKLKWGCDGVKHFKENLNFLMKEFKLLFPDCLIIWITTYPIACELKGGFLVKELQFLKYSLRFHVVEANHYARKVVVENGFDVLDTHYHLHMQIHRRCNDGIHWLPKAVRYTTNLVLRHISLSWNVALPHRYESASVDENLLASGDITNPEIVKAEEADMIQICSEELASPSESKENVVKTTNEQDKTKEKNSVPLHKLPRKKEGIHNHMAKNNKKARYKRIHQWKQHIIDHPIAASSSTVPRVWNHPMFNPNVQPYSTSSHFAHQDLPPNNNRVSYPSSDFNFPRFNFLVNRRSNVRGQSYFQNYSVPYVFPSVVPGQPLHPNFNFANDEIPPNFHF